MALSAVKTYKEHYPKLRFIGRKYTNADRGSDGFGKQWKEWMNDGIYEKLI